jgi:hypothetical protein
MGNKKYLLGILVIGILFTFIGCDMDGSGNGGTTITYDPVGIWDLTIPGQSATVTVTGTNWTFDGPGTDYDDTGTFTRSGNVATLYSNSWGTNIGTVTLTSNTTMTLTLFSPSEIQGTFNGTKRGGSGGV